MTDIDLYFNQKADLIADALTVPGKRREICLLTPIGYENPTIE